MLVSVATGRCSAAGCRHITARERALGACRGRRAVAMLAHKVPSSKWLKKPMLHPAQQFALKRL
jgi:hypothetical protein